MYGIYCKDEKDWLREFNNIAILAFTEKEDAELRAASHYGYDTYVEAFADDWCEVCFLKENNHNVS